MTKETGAEIGAEESNNDEATKNVQQGANYSNLVDELEKLKKEISTRDKALTETQKRLKAIEEEKKQKELSNKSAEEKLAILEAENKRFKQEQEFRKAFAEKGLNPDDFIDAINTSDYELQASKISDILNKYSTMTAEQKLEAFKKEHLERVEKGKPNTNINQEDDDPFLKGLKRGTSSRI